MAKTCDSKWNRYLHITATRGKLNLLNGLAAAPNHNADLKIREKIIQNNNNNKYEL